MQIINNRIQQAYSNSRTGIWVDNEGKQDFYVKKNVMLFWEISAIVFFIFSAKVLTCIKQINVITAFNQSFNSMVTKDNGINNFGFQKQNQC